MNNKKIILIITAILIFFVIVFFADKVFASYSLPPTVQRGDQLVASSTTQVIRVPTSTAGSIWTMFGGFPTWKASSTLGFQPLITLTTTGTSGPATLIGPQLNIPSYTGGGISSVSTGTSGSILNVSITGSNININLPFASSLNSGQLQPADFTNFNNKIGGVGTNGYIPIFTGTNTVSTSTLTENTTTGGLTVLPLQNSVAFSINNASGTPVLVVDNTASSTSNLFAISSSTNGSIFFSINQAGSSTIGSLGLGVVRSTSLGSLFNGLVNLISEVTGVLPVVNGGNGTTTPGIVAGSNITISGVWPFQTINSTASGGGSGNTTWSIFNGGIYNGSSVASNTNDSILIGTTTPTTSKVLIQGTSTKSNIFQVTSSTGNSILKVDSLSQVTVGNVANPGMEFYDDGNMRIDGVLTMQGNNLGGSGNMALASTYLHLFINGDSYVENNNASNAGLCIGQGLILSGYGGFFSGNKGIRLDCSGTMGVNTTTTNSVLTIQATSTISGVGSADLVTVASSSGATLFSVKASGNVGIGTSSPQSTLYVQGSGTTFPFRVASSTGTDLLTLTPLGKLGVGTSSPTANFAVMGGTGVASFYGTSGLLTNYTINIPGSLSSNTLYRMGTFNLTSNAGGFAINSGPSFEFTTNGTNLANLGVLSDANDGNDGYYSFRVRNANTVREALVVDGSSTKPTLLITSMPNAGTVVSIASSSGTSLVSVLGNGNVGISTTTPAYKLAVIGAVQLPNLTTSAGTFAGFLCASSIGEVINDSGTSCVVSSKRFKYRFDKGDYGLNLFLNLPAKSYYYKPDYLGKSINNINANGKQEGVFAEDVAALAPELATYQNSTSTYDGASPGAVEGLQDFTHWLGPTAQAFQDLQKEIDNIPTEKVKRSMEENWQDGIIGLLIIYVIYNEFSKRRKKF